MNTIFKPLGSAFAGIVFLPTLIKSLLMGDSFYAIALKRFYLRQLRLLKGELHYPEQIGVLNKYSFIYQNFLSIYLCYVLLGRRWFVVVSLVFYVLMAMTTFRTGTTELTVVLIVMFLTSAISVFILMERGNYQTLGIVIGILSSYIWIHEQHIGYAHYILLLVTLALSSSAFVLTAITAAAFTQSHFILSVVTVSFVTAFLLCNAIYISTTGRNSKENILRSISYGITSVVHVVSGKSRKTELNIVRSLEISRGLACASPFIILSLITSNDIASTSSVIAALILFINQSKIFRLFDFHFVYWFFYGLIVAIFISSAHIGSYELLCLYIIGTNPLILYGLNKAKGNQLDRMFSIISPTFVDYSKEKSIESRIIERMKGSTCYLFYDKITSTDENKVDYNQIIGDKGLALEFIWDALESTSTLYFPDWYSLFYSENGFYLYKQMISADNNNFCDCIGFISISPNDYTHMDHSNSPKTVNLSDIFGERIVTSYFPNDQYFIQKSA